MIEEKWELIPNYENKYKISNYGKLISLRGGKEKQIFPYKNPSGYEIVYLSKNGIQKRFTVHFLVASIFLPKVTGKDYINHKNTIRDDNRVENLEWCTQKENCQVDNKRQTFKNCKKVKCLETLKIFNSITAACKFLKCSNSYFTRYINGKYTHIKGYHFEILGGLNDNFKV